MKTRKGFKPDNSIKIVNIDSLKRPRRGHFIIHFDGKQWKKAISGLKAVNTTTEENIVLERSVMFVPIAPNRPEAGVLVLPSACPNGCVKLTWPREDGLGRCDCGKPNLPEPSPGDAGSPQLQRGCSLVLLGGSFHCVGIGCGSNCRPELRFTGSFGVSYVVCVCS